MKRTKKTFDLSYWTGLYNNKVEDVYVLPYSNEHFLDIPNIIDSLIFAGIYGLTLMNLISI